MVNTYLKNIIVKYVRTNSLIFASTNLFKRGVNFLFVILLARTIDINQFGEYSSCLFIISLMMIFSNFGFNEYILSNSSTKWKLGVNFSIFLLFSFSIVVAFSLLAYILNIGNVILVVLLILKIYLDTSLNNIFLAYFQVSNNIGRINCYYNISSIIILTSILICYYYQLSIYYFLMSYVVGGVVQYILALLFIRPVFKIRFIRIFLRTISAIKYYGLSTITVAAYMLLPNFIGSLLITEKDLAVYQIAYTIANVVLLISVSLIQFGYKDLINLKGHDFVNFLKRLRSRVLLINFMFIIFLFFVGKDIINLIIRNNQYSDSWMFLLVLLFANIFQSLSATYLMPLVVFKLQKIKYNINFELIIVAMVTSLALISFIGVYGLCLSYLILYVYSFIRFYKVSKKILKYEKNYF